MSDFNPANDLDDSFPRDPWAGAGSPIFFGALGGIRAGLTGYFIQPIRNAKDILSEDVAAPVVEPA